MIKKGLAAEAPEDFRCETMSKTGSLPNEPVTQEF